MNNIVNKLRLNQCPDNMGCNPLVEFCQCAMMDEASDKIAELEEALTVIKAEAERIQGGNGNLQHLIRCIHVQVNGALVVK